VQAAPVGLAATITGAALVGTSIAATATVTITKAIAMTTLQKTLITATLAAAVGTGIYEVRQAAGLRTQVRTLQQQEAANAEQIERVGRERDEATARQAMLQSENDRLHEAAAEVQKLRAEVARLQATQRPLTQARPAAVDTSDPFTQSVLALTAKAVELSQRLEQMPDKKIPELQFLTENDWLRAVQDARFDTDAGVRKALSKLRSLAKDKLPMGSTLYSYTRASNGQLPTDLSQLKPYFRIPVDDVILARYKLLHTGNLSDFPVGTWLISEKAPVDRDYDSRAKFGNGTGTIISTGIGEAGDPEDPGY
jgi:hypothetical protein